MLLLDTNWSHIWMVTLLGFGIVFLLLVVLIYILKLFGWIMQQPNKQQPAEPLEKPSTPTTTSTNNDQDIAAIALTLHLYYNNGLHDRPAPKLTFAKPQKTDWNNKLLMFNQ